MMQSRSWIACWRLALATLFVAAGLAPVTITSAQTPAAASFDPSSFGLSLEPVVSGLDQPVFMVDPGDGRGRWLVVEQPGRIVVVADGVVQPEPLLDLTGVVNAGGSEQGLLSVALHPDFATNGQLFVGYTANTGDGSGDNSVARFVADPETLAPIDPASGEVLLAVSDPYPNHNGGLVMFGPDGFLYAGMGDGGSGGDPENNGQNPETLLGTILRLDVDGSNAGAYGIPADNPFAGSEVAAPEIWATGLRNPWRFSFDRATGDLYIADVGQNRIEEINVQPAESDGGDNYGWNIMEGTDCFLEPDCDQTDLVLPAAEYTHEFGCSVTGGYVYRGEAIPALQGVYLFADYCTGLLWGMGRDADGEWLVSEPIETGLNPASFAEDATGELYIIVGDGTIYAITAPAT